MKHLTDLLSYMIVGAFIGVVSSVFAAWAKGRKIQVHGWVYSLKDGLIKDLGVTRTKYEEEEGAVGTGG